MVFGHFPIRPKSTKNHGFKKSAFSHTDFASTVTTSHQNDPISRYDTQKMILVKILTLLDAYCSQKKSFWGSKLFDPQKKLDQKSKVLKIHQKIKNHPKK